MRFVLYTRAGCHLCDDASDILREFQTRYGFVVDVVDIDTSAELIAEHGHWVPVIAVNGKVRFRGAVNRVLLQRLLDAPSP